MASDITFHYFHGRGIGEPIRLLLTVGEVAFTDRRYSVDEFADMAAFKAQLPFGQMPALEVDGVFLGQTDSIARLAARLADLCVFNRLNHLLDMNADVLQGDFPKLQAVYDRVEALPQIEAWMQAHQDDYPRFKARTAA